jgi:hypothetical protein
MRMPRVRVSWAMIFIAIVALELAVLRAMMRFSSLSFTTTWQVQMVGVACQGVLTVLALGLLVGYRRRASRPFLVGFEAFGIAALILYIACVVSFSQELIPLFQTAVRPIVSLVADGPTISTGTVWLFAGIVECAISLPLLAFAALGGFLTHRRSAPGIIAVLAGAPIGVLLAWLGVAYGMVQPSDVKFHTLTGAVIGLLAGIVLGVLTPSPRISRDPSRRPAAEVGSQEPAYAQDQG